MEKSKKLSNSMGIIIRKDIKVPLENQIKKREFIKALGKNVKCFGDNIQFNNSVVNFNEIKVAYVKWNYLYGEYDKSRIVIVKDEKDRDGLCVRMMVKVDKDPEKIVEYIDHVVEEKNNCEDDDSRFNYYFSIIQGKEFVPEDKIACINKIMNLDSKLSEDKEELLKEYQIYGMCREAIMLFEENIYHKKNKGEVKNKYPHDEEIRQRYKRAWEKYKKGRENDLYEAYAYSIEMFLKYSKEISGNSRLIKEFNDVCDEFLEKIKEKKIRGDYGEKFDCYKQKKWDLAEKFEIATKLGIQFYQNLEIKNDEKSLSWIEMALNCEGAENEIMYKDLLVCKAELYAIKKDVPERENTIVECYEKAALRGNPIAEFELYKYYEGKGEQDLANQYKKRAGEHGIQSEKEFKEMKQKAFMDALRTFADMFKIVKEPIQDMVGVAQDVANTVDGIEEVKQRAWGRKEERINAKKDKESGEQ